MADFTRYSRPRPVTPAACATRGSRRARPPPPTPDALRATGSGGGPRVPAVRFHSAPVTPRAWPTACTGRASRSVPPSWLACVLSPRSAPTPWVNPCSPTALALWLSRYRAPARAAPDVIPTLRRYAPPLAPRAPACHAGCLRYARQPSRHASLVCSGPVTRRAWPTACTSRARPSAIGAPPDSR